MVTPDTTTRMKSRDGGGGADAHVCCDNGGLYDVHNACRDHDFCAYVHNAYRNHGNRNDDHNWGVRTRGVLCLHGVHCDARHDGYHDVSRFLSRACHVVLCGVWPDARNDYHHGLYQPLPALRQL